MGVHPGPPSEDAGDVEAWEEAQNNDVGQSKGERLPLHEKGGMARRGLW